MGSFRESERLLWWRQGDVIVCQPGATLPDRCMACNGPTSGFGLHGWARMPSEDEAERMLGPFRFLGG